MRKLNSFLILLIFASTIQHNFAESEVIWSKRRASTFLTSTKRPRRSVGELGNNEHVSRPWNWGLRVFGDLSKFSVTFMELRELKDYPGAWFKKPDRENFKDMQSDMKNKIVGDGGDKLDFIEIVRDDKDLKKKFNDQLYTLYWRYMQCLRGKDKLRNCPDPCNESGVCKDVDLALPGRCRSYEDKSITVKLHTNGKVFQPLFQRNFDCQCQDGYAFDRKTRKCVDARKDCISMLSGKNPCYNGGTCREAKDASLGYTCDCMPAFTGDSCQVPRDPCRGEQVCDRFTCKRDPANWQLGYTCLCQEKPGWEKYSDNMPKCMDIDECHLKKPCLNGGTCNNTLGSYACSCPNGWVGKHCEHRDIVEAQWGEWAAYAKCTVTCGEFGTEVAHRKCNLAGRCIGTNSRTRKCRNIPQHCEAQAVFDDSFGFILQSGANNGVYGKYGLQDAATIEQTNVEEAEVEEVEQYYIDEDEADENTENYMYQLQQETKVEDNVQKATNGAEQFVMSHKAPVLRQKDPNEEEIAASGSQRLNYIYVTIVLLVSLAFLYRRTFSYFCIIMWVTF